MATGVLDVNGTKYKFSQNGELVGDSKPNNGRNFTSDGKLVKESDEISAETVHDESEKSDTNSVAASDKFVLTDIITRFIGVKDA